MNKDISNKALILIGMPGAGKSTLGVLLAKSLAKPYIDTDLIIQQRAGMTLQDYLDKNGYLALRNLEEQVLLEENYSGCVVATGGSAVYSEKGMNQIKKWGSRIYLKISLETLLNRVTNQDERGLACAPGTSLAMLFEERCPLYERFADITVDLNDLNHDQSLSKVISSISVSSLN